MLKNEYPKPVRMLTITIISIFVAEAFVMMILLVLPILSLYQMILLDTLLLIIIVFPLLYYYLYRPMVLHIKESRRVEESLKDSEEKYRTLTGNVPGMVYRGKSDWSTEIISKSMDICGYASEAFNFKKISWLDIIHPDDKEKVINESGELKKNRLSSVQVYRIVNREGGVRWVEDHKCSRFSKEGTFLGVDGIVFDITERKQSEIELTEEKNKLESVIGAMTAGLSIRDLEYNIVYESPMVIDIFGNNAGRKCYEVYEKEDKICEGCPVALAYKDGKTHTALRKVAMPDGSITYWENTANPIRDAEGAVTSCLEIAADVTDRFKAAEAIRESEERFKRLVELNPDGIYICRDGKILYVNQATIDILGAKSAEELIGKSIFDLIHPNFREKAKQRSQLVIEKGVSVPLIDFIYCRLDKGETHVQAIASPLMFEGEHAVLSTVRDITEQRKAEADKALLETQLRQSQKMEAIGTLAGGIAHDFNNILSPIMIHSEMAMLDLPPDSPVRHNLKEIFKAGERARDMVKQILAFSRKERQERTPIRLRAVLKEAVKLLRPSIPTTIDIRQHNEAAMDIVFANHTQIQQVILNLCANATHAMREKGGVLEIGLSDHYLDSRGAGEFETPKPGRYLRLTVTDTGYGIPPDVIDKIFDPYFTTKETGEGTGMGLSVAHGIVKSHGGDITVESEPEKGTTFHVLLPKYEEETADTPSERIVKLPGGTERILFVDDEKGAVDAIQSMLMNLGYQVTARTSSIEALEAFRNKPDAFDLVITDMTMPNMTGKELAKEIMSIRPDISIILCTGFSEQIDEKKAKEMGISAFVMKPIVMRDIANTIREVLNPALSKR